MIYDTPKHNHAPAMTTTDTNETAKEIANLARRALYWIECGKLHHAERLLETIEAFADDLAELPPPNSTPTTPSAGELAAACAWSLDTLTEFIRPDARQWELIDTARELIELAQPSQADRAPFRKADQ